MMRSSSLALGAMAATVVASSAAADTVAFKPGFYAGGFVGWVNSHSEAEGFAIPQGTAAPLQIGGTPPTDINNDGIQANTLLSGGGPSGTFGNGSDSDGWSGGALIGYSVIGQGMFAAIEADVSLIDDGGSRSSRGTGGSYTATFINPDDADQTGDIESITSTSSGTVSSKLTADSTFRIRLGTEIGYGMRIFATGGLALGRLEHRATITKTDTIIEDNANPNAGDPALTPTSTVTAISRTWQTGWTLGGGLDVALWGPWSARVEYRYIDLGTGKLTVNFADGSVQTIKFVDTEQSVRFGLVYAF